jgi:hypothetical protein
MKRGLSRPAIWAVIVALGVELAAFGLGSWSRHATRKPKEPRPPKVLAVRPPEVRRVILESRGGRVEFARAGDGAWTGGSAASPVTETLLPDIEARLFPLGAYRRLRADASDLSYGLVDPEITLTIDGARRDRHRVFLGAATFTTGGYYAQSETDPHYVYLVPRRIMDDLRSLLAGRRIDARNDLPSKIRERNQQEEAPKDSWWLQQVLDHQPMQ